jgi:DNA-directed RNA polymerase specialized sigma24 family protein
MKMDGVNLPIGERGVNRAEFETFLGRLDPDRERAAEKYEDLRRRLIRFFRWNNCFPGDDLVDKTFDRVAHKVADEQVSAHIPDVVPFLWGVARNVVREFRRRPPAVNLEDLPPRRQPHTAHAESVIIEQRVRERRLACLRKCLELLAARDRELFLAYEYYQGRTRNTRQLAERFGTSVGALQVKAHRLKHKLEKCALKRFLSLEKSLEEPLQDSPR